jgi:predicted nucleotide-binding protein (sugar kinase/HSP70/actin superfamily)
MKITFPHIGNSYIPIKAMFDDLGVETIVPPRCSKKTLELGTKYSPELICLPLKITLGNYLESIEKGADTIVITGGCGPCRFGYYCEVQREILKDLGYDVDIVVIEAPQGDKSELLRRVSKLANTKNVIKIGKSLKNAITILKKLNKLEEMVLEIRPYEISENKIDDIYNGVIKNLEASIGSKEMINHLNNALGAIQEVPLDRNRDVLKIGLVGEIYTVIEDFSNLDIGKKLNKMGVEVHKSLSTGEWITDMLFYRSLGLSKEAKIWEAAKPYVKTCIGGHARETVGNTVLYSQMGYDGVIQLMPFTCMPEIVAMSLMPSIQVDNNIPVLTLIIDEMTGEGGYLTRLEAFIDLLRNRKEKKQYEEVLS